MQASKVSNSAERVDIGGWYGIIKKALKTVYPYSYHSYLSLSAELDRAPVAAEKKQLMLKLSDVSRRLSGGGGGGAGVKEVLGGEERKEDHKLWSSSPPRG